MKDIQSIGENLVSTEMGGGLHGFAFDPSVTLRDAKPGKDGLSKSTLVAETSEYAGSHFSVNGQEFKAIVKVYRVNKPADRPVADNSKLISTLSKGK